VAEPDVERGEREPGPVGLDDPLRQLLPEVAQVPGRGDHALPRVGPVRDAQVARGVLGELHEAAHAGLAGRARIPLRLLVGDRREQAPVDAGRLLRGDEHGLPGGERGAHALHEHFGVEAPDLAARREIALDEPGERTVAAHAREERVELVREAGVPAPDRPGELALRAERERDVDVEVDVASERGVDRGDDRVVDLALVDGREQRIGRRRLHRHPSDLGMVAPDQREHALDARGLDVRDLGAGQVPESARPVAVAGVNDDGFGGFVAGRPQERRADADLLRGRLRVEWTVEPADADVRLARDDPVDQRARVGHRHDGQRQSALAGEPLDQVVVEALDRAVGAGEPAPGARPDRDDERLRLVRRGQLGDAAGADERGERERRRPRREARLPVLHDLLQAMSQRSEGRRTVSVDEGGRQKGCGGRGLAGYNALVRPPRTVLVPVPRRVAPHCMVVNLVRSGRKQP